MVIQLIIEELKEEEVNGWFCPENIKIAYFCSLTLLENSMDMLIFFPIKSIK